MEEGIVIPIEADDSQFFASMKNIESAVKQGLRSLDKFSKATKNMTKVEFAVAKTDQMDAVNKKIAETIEQMGKLAEEISELQKKANSPESSLADILEASIGIDDKRAQIRALEKRQTYLQTFASGLGSLEQGARVKQGSGTFDKLKSVLGGIGKVAGTAGSALKKAFSGVVSIVGRVASGIKGVVSSIAGIGKRALSAINPLKSMFGAMLGAQSVYGILRKAVSAYMADNEELSARMTNLWSSLGNLIGPIIDRIVSFLARGISYLTQFLALFGGVTKKAKAAGGAAKKAKDVLQIDELNKLSDESGGGGGGADPSEYEMPEWLKDMAELLKAGEWEKAGTLLADKLNEMVNSVDWAGLGQKIGYYFGGALKFIATAIREFDWNNLGAKIAIFINNMFSQIDFADLGTILAAKLTIPIRMIGSFLENLDPSILAKSFSDFAISFLNGISEAIQSVDWQKVGNNVAQFLREVDWAGVFDAVTEAIGSVLGGLSGFLWGLIEEAWDEVVQWWKDTAYEDGEFTMEGLLEGILEKIKDIGAWVKEHIFQPFIDGFKSAFGIASPSTVMQEQGNFVVEGLLKGISEKWESVKSFFQEKVPELKEKLSDGWEQIKQNASEKWEGIKEKIRNTFGSAQQEVSTVSSEMESKTSQGMSNMKNTTTSTMSSIATEVSNKGNEIKTSLSSAWDSVKNTANDKFTSMANQMRSLFANLKTSLYSIGSSFIDIGRNMVMGIWNGIVSLWGSVVSRVQQMVSDLVNTIRGVLRINSPSKVFEEIFQYTMKGAIVGIEDEQGNVINAMRNVAEQVAGTTIEPPQVAQGTVLPYSANGQETKLQEAIAQLNISNRDVVTAVLAIGEMIVNAVNNKDTVVELDGKQISETVTRMQRQAERAMG